MSILTLHISDEKHAKLRQVAASRHISLNDLLDELTTVALTEHELRNEFKLAANRGDPIKGLVILDELDTHFSITSEAKVPGSL
jgi:transcriptional regulator of met regulon